MSGFSRITKSTPKVPKLINPGKQIFKPNNALRNFSYQGRGSKVDTPTGPGETIEEFQKPFPVLPQQQDVRILYII